MKSFVFLILFPFLAIAAPSVKSELEFSAIRYFVDASHPQTGLVLDKVNNFNVRSPDNRVASIAATGFGLAVAANAAKRGLLNRSSAEAHILKTLQFARDHVPRRNGWFLHWVDWETGSRAWKSEFSPIDTALFLAGALYASEIFPGGQIAAITDEIYRQVDFYDYLTNGGALPDKRTMSLSWTPERGYEPYEWEIYAEQKIMLLLGLGHPTKPLPIDAWFGWKRFNDFMSVASGIMGYNVPLFIHQYSEVFFDFRKLQDGFSDYHLNGIRVTKIHRDMLTKANFQTFKAGYWGVSAGEDPDGYKVYHPSLYNGTVCIGCTVASAMFTPEIVANDLLKWRNGKHKEKIWGRYGFVDSINLDRNWYAGNVLGITVGPAYMSLANMNASTSIWKDFMNISSMKKAIQRIRERR